MLATAIVEFAAHPILLIVVGGGLWVHLHLKLYGTLALIGILIALAILARAIAASSKRVGQVTLRIGVDGIFVSGVRSASRPVRRFLSYQDVEEVSSNNSVVTLHMRGREPIELRSLRSEGEAIEMSDVIVARVGAVKQLSASRTAQDVERLPTRGERATRQWLREVRELASRVDYRAPAIRLESFWSVVEGPSRNESERVAAAVALRQQLDDDGAERMRAAVDACASPRTRAALEAILDTNEDDDRLADKLESVIAAGNLL